jgi:hypothetical protein
VISNHKSKLEMGLRALFRNKRHITNLCQSLIAAKGRVPLTDAYTRLITTIAPAAAAAATISSAHEQRSSWQMTCWAAAAAALLGATTTVALSEADSSPSADKVSSNTSFAIPACPRLPCVHFLSFL